MERTSHNDSREEDKREKEAKSRYTDRIKDARSESRIEKFMPTKLKDPRENSKKYRTFKPRIDDRKYLKKIDQRRKLQGKTSKKKEKT